MIYIFTEYDSISLDILNNLTEKLPPKRKEKVLRHKNHQNKISSIIGYYLFLYGYRNLLNKKGLPDFSFLEGGKPYISGEPDVFFNISHCKNAVACVFGKNPVGIDIQELRHFSPSITKHICSDEELAIINSSTDPSNEFFRLWTIKESLAKLSGEGMIFGKIQALSPKGLNVFTSFIAPDKYMTVASEDFSCDYTINYLSLDDILGLF